MKNKLTLFLTLFLTVVLCTSSVLIYNSGIAGYTGSPGEANCSSCHSGGSSLSSAISISSTPSFSNNQYVPGTTYTIEITVTASGFSKFGFGCEILNASNANAGLIQTAGPGVKFMNITVQGTQRKNAVHTTGKLNAGSANFTFEWVAPQTGAATIYVSGNAVNANNSSSGDFPITPVSLALQAEIPIDPVAIKETNALLGELSIYPQPCNGITNLSYVLKQSSLIEISICDVSGKELKRFNEGKLQQGQHNKLLNLEGISAGVYFVKLLGEGKKLSQKLLIVN
jgi:hypothetical protein